MSLCMRGDLQAAWEALDLKLTAPSDDTEKLAVSKEQRDIARQMLDLETEMKDATLTLRLRALSRVKWDELLADHPARKDNRQDLGLGVNNSTFWDAILREMLVSPKLDERRISKLLDKLTPRQFDVLATASWDLNQADVSIPFSLNASRIAQNSGATSRRRSGSASPSDASRAGNRKKS